MKSTDVTQEEARQLFDYEDGKLIWKLRPKGDFRTVQAWADWNNRYPGKPAGSFGPSGYAMIGVRINGVKRAILLHRAIWSWHYGPAENEIDHKDQDTLNNRIGNLRPATGSQNKAHRRQFIDRTCGFMGVSYEKSRNRWKASISKEGSSVTLGRFKCPTLAAIAYDVAASDHHGEFAMLNVIGARRPVR